MRMKFLLEAPVSTATAHWNRNCTAKVTSKFHRDVRLKAIALPMKGHKSYTTTPTLRNKPRLAAWLQRANRAAQYLPFIPQGIEPKPTAQLVRPPLETFLSVANLTMIY